MLQWFNERIGKTQRLAALHFIAELPRSAIGKVLKRELRELHRTLVPHQNGAPASVRRDVHDLSPPGRP